MVIKNMHGQTLRCHCGYIHNNLFILIPHIRNAFYMEEVFDDIFFFTRVRQTHLPSEGLHKITTDYYTVLHCKIFHTPTSIPLTLQGHNQGQHCHDCWKMFSSVVFQMSGFKVSLIKLKLITWYMDKNIALYSYISVVIHLVMTSLILPNFSHLIRICNFSGQQAFFALQNNCTVQEINTHSVLTKKNCGGMRWYVVVLWYQMVIRQYCMTTIYMYCKISKVIQAT